MPTFEVRSVHDDEEEVAYPINNLSQARTHAESVVTQDDCLEVVLVSAETSVVEVLKGDIARLENGLDDDFPGWTEGTVG